MIGFFVSLRMTSDHSSRGPPEVPGRRDRPWIDRTRRLRRPPSPWVRPGAASAVRCSAADLGDGSVFKQGATGSMVGGVRLRNMTGHDCTLRGIPALTLVARGGAAISTRLVRRATAFGASPTGATTRSSRCDPEDRRSSISPGGTIAAGHASDRFGSHGVAAASPRRPQKPDSPGAISRRPGRRCPSAGSNPASGWWRRRRHRRPNCRFASTSRRRQSPDPVGASPTG